MGGWGVNGWVGGEWVGWGGEWVGWWGVNGWVGGTILL